MPPKLNVAGSVELYGHEVCLRLAPTSMSSASTSATVPTLSLLDKQPPSTMDIMAQIQQGTLVCHESRRGVSAQELGQRIHAIQAALALWPRGMQGAWSAAESQTWPKTICCCGWCRRQAFEDRKHARLCSLQKEGAAWTGRTTWGHSLSSSHWRRKWDSEARE